MASVDDKIVSIRFDNESFQKRVADTIASLDKLKASLTLANAGEGMRQVSAAANSMDLSHIGVNIESVSSKFLALGTVAITVLSNITTKAIAAGGQLVSALTLDPLVSGFQEYETNMNSIQTILSNTRADGTNLEQVNAALDQLNTYSDQTIYNFSQMAKNIGTFTAAGVNLDTSVTAIKGIANLAAISGSNAEQASTAMYQLSQALSSGSVKLMDWNSIVNAGMGGEVFQKALFETGKMMGTIANTDMSTTFEEWTAAGNTFRGSLEEGWLTADVLTNTLQGFTGDLTEAQILAMGYTQEQAAEIMALGASGKAAATEVKTLTQLFGTVKESIGSGWSSSFRLIIGNFEEAKALFTGINSAIGGFVGTMSDARNSMLEEWRFFGGREKLIDGLKNAFFALGNILRPIKEAFREIFPPATALTLITLTQRFGEFTAKISFLTFVYMPKIKTIFQGFFALLEIGWTILKNVAGVIGSVFGAIVGTAGGPVIGVLEALSNKFIALNDLLVEGGGIADFFEDVFGGLPDLIKKPIEMIVALKDAIVGFFSGAVGGSSDVMEGAFGRVGDRVESVTSIWERFTDGLSRVGDILSDVWDAIASFFGELGSRIAGVMGEGDFDMALDALSVGLLGGIAVMIRRFLRGGLNFDLGGGLFESVRHAFEGLTSTLSALQAQIQSRTLINIAIAVGVLTASIVVLSLIDSAALARSLAAMTVGFTELIAAMRLLSSGDSARSQGQIAIMAFSLILLAGAMLILSVAMKIMSTMSWNDIIQGMAGISLGLAGLVLAINNIGDNREGMIRAGIGMIAMSLALLLMSVAVKSFASMDMVQMGQGMVAMGIGLAAIVLAMKAMPSEGMAAQGLGMLLLGLALNSLANSIARFATIGWGTLVHGLIGIGAALLIIANTMRMMPTDLPVLALGLGLVGIALIILAKAVESMASIPFGDMVKGLAAMAVTLFILSVAMNSMQGAAPGAAAIVIVSAALMILVQVLKVLGGMSLSELAIGIGAIAAVLLVLGIAAAVLSPLLPSMMALGIALALIGAGFALFGAGAFFAAKAFELIANSGETSINKIIDVINTLLRALPGFVSTFVTGMIQGFTDSLSAVPMLIDTFKALLTKLLDAVIEMVPKIGEAFRSIVIEALANIRVLFPQVLATGLALVINLLHGIQNSITSIVEAAVDLIISFADALMDNSSRLADSGINLIVTFVNAIAERAELLVAAGLGLLTSLLNGIAENIHLVTEAVGNLITSFIEALVGLQQDIIDAGFGVLTSFLQGIADNILDVVDTVTDIIVQFITAIGTHAQEILDAGFWLLTTLIGGIAGHILDVVTMVGTIVTTFVTEMGNQASRFIAAGADALIKFLDGIEEGGTAVIEKGVAVAVALLDAAASSAVDFVDHGLSVLVAFLDGMATAVRTHSQEINRAGLNLADALIDGVVDGLDMVGDALKDKMLDLAHDAWEGVKDFFHVGSPSRLMMWLGNMLMEGMIIGIDEKGDKVIASASNVSKRTMQAFEDSLGKVRFSMSGMDELNPVITPVLDLTKIKMGAKSIQGMMAVSTITPDVSFQKANLISTTAELEKTTEPTPFTGPTETTFIQNNYSPEALSTNDIYKNTKSQIALAKEELNIA